MAATNTERAGTAQLGDETFMSAAQLRSYMIQMETAKALKGSDGMDRAEKAREELIKSLSQPVDLTPKKEHEITQQIFPG